MKLRGIFWRGGIVLAAALTAFAGVYLALRDDVVVRRVIAKARAGETRADFATEVPVAFDQMAIFGGYEGRDQAERTLGFACPDFGDFIDENDDRVLFFRGHAIVYRFDVRRSRLAFDANERPLLFAQDATKFAVEWRGGQAILRPLVPPSKRTIDAR